MSAPVLGAEREQEVRGRISLVQEDRFRIETVYGQSLLFVLGRKAKVSSHELARHAGTGVIVTVRFHGDPDSGAVADEVRP